MSTDRLPMDPQIQHPAYFLEDKIVPPKRKTTQKTPRQIVQRGERTAISMALVLAAIFGIVAILAATGCAGKGAIKAEAIDATLRRVVDRHQDYVQKDDKIDKFKKEIALRDGRLLIGVLDDAKAQKEGK